MDRNLGLLKSEGDVEVVEEAILAHLVQREVVDASDVERVLLTLGVDGADADGEPLIKHFEVDGIKYSDNGKTFKFGC